jgi:hypothetical protein
MRLIKTKVFPYKDHRICNVVFWLYFFRPIKLLSIKRTTIQRHDGVDYLIRYSLFSCKFFSLKLHHILSSDDDCLHDHPWFFISCLLAGSYVEESTKGYKGYSRGSILFRPARWKHRLIINKPVWSLVTTFRKVREWGFWTKKGFIPWNEYEQNMCE